MSGETITLYEAIGGDATVRALTRRFYELMDTLPEAAHCRAIHPADLSGSEAKFYDYLTGYLGGPPVYVEKHGHPMLRRYRGCENSCPPSRCYEHFVWKRFLDRGHQYWQCELNHLAWRLEELCQWYAPAPACLPPTLPTIPNGCRCRCRCLQINHEPLLGLILRCL